MLGPTTRAEWQQSRWSRDGRSRGDESEPFGFHLRTGDGTAIGNFGMSRDSAGALDGGVTLTMSDRTGHPRLQMLMAGDGTPSMLLLDATATLTWSAPLTVALGFKQRSPNPGCGGSEK